MSCLRIDRLRIDDVMLANRLRVEWSRVISVHRLGLQGPAAHAEAHPEQDASQEAERWPYDRVYSG